ncbi:MAG: PTS system mannose/fructose/sorbose family transporter subunit IID [Gemmatimonadales bacterium]
MAALTAAALKTALGRALLRLFSVQSSYNYERLLGIGTGVAEEPLLRDLAVDGTEGGGRYRAAVARGAHFFNAHPYLTGLAVGAAARAEHDGVPADQIERLRAALCGPLGSLGDRLIWAGWLPLLSGLTVVAVALGAGWAAVAGFLVVYNAGHVALRWWALRAGWEHGARVGLALHHPFFHRAGAVLGPAMAFAMGAALPLAAAYLGGAFEPWARGALAATATAALLALHWRAGRLTGLQLALGLGAGACALGWLWP